MKQLIIILLSIISGTNLLLAQSNVEFYSEKGELLPDTVLISTKEIIPQEGGDYFFYFKLKNNTSEKIELKIKGEEQSDFKSNGFGYCTSSCVPAPGVTGAFTIAAEDFYRSIDGKNLYVQFVAEGSEGVFYGSLKVLNADDTSIVEGSRVLKFEKGTVGIKESSKLAEKFELYPNPASDQVVIRYNASKNYTNSQVIVRNLVGVVVKTIPLINTESEVSASLKDLAAGVYFYSLITDGVIVSTKKLIIRR